MNRYDLDQALLEISDDSEVFPWTIRDAVEGVQIFGGIGSGKTSGSGRMLALKYLQAGFGGLVLTAKPDEKKLWQHYCQITGRVGDLVVLEQGGEHAFNFLEYESLGHGDTETYAENLVQVLKTVIKASEERSGNKSDDAFWDNALDMLMFNVIDLCILAYGKVAIQDIYDIVMSAPKKDDVSNNELPVRTAFRRAFEKATEKIEKQVVSWEATLPAATLAEMDQHEYETGLFEFAPQARILRSIDNFFIDNYSSISEKTRSLIDFSFSGFLFRLLRDPIYSLFCKRPSTVTPDDCLKGKIILLNLPVKLFHKVGRDSQLLFKYIWQRSMEKREIEANDRPVFLWADEAQNFLHEHDADYQATARSSRICTVYISQNLPNYLANMGGERFQARVNSFLGTLGTKFFHANADVETNKYASELIGQAYIANLSKSTTVSGDFAMQNGLSYILEYMVRPEQFVGLRGGAPINNYRVECIMHRQGRPFTNGRNHKKLTFNQQYSPQIPLL